MKIKLFFVLMSILFIVPVYASGDIITFSFESSSRDDIHKDFLVDRKEAGRVFDLKHNVSRFIVEIRNDPFLFYIGSGAITEKEAVHNSRIINIKGEYGFLWGYGLVKDYELNETLRLCLKGRYIEHSGKGKNFSGDMRSEEWFVSASLEKDVSNFILYGGATYYDEDNMVEGEFPEYGYVDWKTGESHTYGCLAGVKYEVSNIFSISIEGRFINQKGVRTSCSWKF